MTNNKLSESQSDEFSRITEIDQLRYIAEKIKKSPFINGGFDDLKNEISDLKQDIKDTNVEIKDIKEKLYNPDDGLYARLVKIDTKTNKHQIWFDLFGKAFWLLIGSIITVLVKLLFGL